MNAYPYLRVVYEMKEIPATSCMEVIYCYVEIVRKTGVPLKYSSGDYKTDISCARSDGSILTSLQEHSSVASFERLRSAKPEERYTLIRAGKIIPPFVS
jgi:hypothetical protein